MKEFLQVMRRFVPPYKKYLVLSVVFNILSALLNIFPSLRSSLSCKYSFRWMAGCGPMNSCPGTENWAI